MERLNIIDTCTPYELTSKSGHHYIKSDNVSAQHYGSGTLYITDLTNAQKAGARCMCIHLEEIERDSCELVNLLAETESFSSLVDLLRSKFGDEEYTGVFKRSWKEYGVRVSVYEKDAVRVFSPFITMKPLAERPKKWTLPHVRRALFNGQAEPVCNHHFTDDYYHDYVVNCETGRKPGALEVCEEITSSPSGWRAYESGKSPGSITLACHSFLSYDLAITI